MMGRAYDIVRAPNGNHIGGTFWSHILKDNVEKFQVTQDELDRIRIAIVPDGEFGGADREYVMKRVREACGERMRVEFEIVQDIAPAPSGKHRYIISRLSAGGDQA